MQPSSPFPPLPGPPRASPANVAAALTSQLAAHGITGVYSATAEKFAVISVTAGLTVWTDGRLLWHGHGGQRRTWPVDDIAAAAAAISALAGRGSGT